MILESTQWNMTWFRLSFSSLFLLYIPPLLLLLFKIGIFAEFSHLTFFSALLFHKSKCFHNLQTPSTVLHLWCMEKSFLLFHYPNHRSKKGENDFLREMNTSLFGFGMEKSCSYRCRINNSARYRESDWARVQYPPIVNSPTWLRVIKFWPFWTFFFG